MSLVYEARCASEPDLPAVARMSTLIMCTLLGVDGTAVTPVEGGILRWGSAAFARVVVSEAEVAGQWCLTAEPGNGDAKFDELVSLVVVAAAALAHGGAVVEENGRLPDRVNEPQELLLRGLRAGTVGPDELVRRMRADGSRRFSPEVERVLRAAGWFPGRKVDTAGWRSLLEVSGEVRMHEEAERFLGEFGGLRVRVSGRGISKAREPFEFSPWDLVGEEDWFVEWGAVLGRSLCPLGVLDQGRFFLGISETGEVYLVDSRLSSFGVGDAALGNLVLGVKPVEVAVLPRRPEEKPVVATRDAGSAEKRYPIGFAPRRW